MIKFKAWNASNSRAIAKFHNTEIGHFGHNAFIHELIRGSLSYAKLSREILTINILGLMPINAATVRAKIVDYVWTYNPCEPGERRSHWHHFLQIMALVGRDLISGLLNLRSMSLVYTTLLAFIPLLAVSMWLLRWIGVHEQLEP